MVLYSITCAFAAFAAIITIWRLIVVIYQPLTIVYRYPLCIVSDGINRYVSTDNPFIGRSRNATLVWEHISISRRHIALVRDEQRNWCAILLGKLPVSLNGTKMVYRQPVQLQNGSILCCETIDHIRFTCTVQLPNNVNIDQPDWLTTVHQRSYEGIALAAISVLLGCTLTAVDVGRRLDIPIALQITDTNPIIILWATFTLGWLAIWILHVLLEYCRYRAWYDHGGASEWIARAPAILPAIALLMAIGTLVTHRTDDHLLYLGQRVDELASDSIRSPGMLHAGLIALIVAIICGSLSEIAIITTDARAGSPIMLRLEHSMQATRQWYQAVCDAIIRATPAQQQLRAIVERLMERHLLITLIGPLAVVGLTIALLFGEMAGIIDRVGGQIVRAFGAQPAEAMRLLISASAIIAASLTIKTMATPHGPGGTLSGRLARWQNVGCMPLLSFATIVLAATCYAIVTRDFGMVLLGVLTVLAIMSLALRQNAWLIALAVIVIITAVGWIYSLQIGTDAAVAQLGRRVQQAYNRPATELPQPTTPTEPDEYVSGTCPICAGDQELRQVAYAIISGGPFGMGPGRGLITPPLPAVPYISAAFSDYAVIVVIEEYGLLGMMLVWAALLLLTVHSFWLGQHIISPWWRTVAVAIAIWWSLQTLVVMAGALRLLPFAGVPVPYISFGRTSVIISGILAGLLLVASSRLRTDAGELAQPHQFGFGIMNVAMRTGFMLIFGAVAIGFTLNIWSRDYRLVQDVELARTLNIASPELEELSHARRMGNRVRCQVYRQPLHALRTRDGEATLFEPLLAPLGCRMFAPPGETPMPLARELHIDQVLRDLLAGSPELMRRIIDGPVETTLDARVQRTVARLVDAGLGAADGEPWAQAVVMDGDGRILALVDRSEQSPARGYQRFQWRWYSPGSVMKVVTAMAALQAGLPPDAPFPCAALPYQDAHPVRNSLGETNCQYAGAQTDLAHALAYSVNTAFVNLTDAVAEPVVRPASLPLTREQFAGTAQQLGFGEVSFDISVQAGGERRPIVLAPYANESLPIISASLGTDAAGMARLRASSSAWADTVFGQANSSMTVIHAAALMQLIASDGEARAPRLLESVASTPWEQEARLDPELARTMQSLLRAAVDLPLASPMVVESVAYRLAGAAASMHGGEQVVAGKTGTAERSDRRPVQWFAGYAQTTDQTYIVAVLMSQEQPHEVGQCSPAAVAGTIFDALLDVSAPLTCAERGR